MPEQTNFSSLAQQAVAHWFRETPLALAVRWAVETLGSYFGWENIANSKLLNILMGAKQGTAGILSEWNTTAANDNHYSVDQPTWISKPDNLPIGRTTIVDESFQKAA